ncbi:SDR family NAD(P)-dependent oxidoreductase [Arthrobacter echini]|uniref:SDR family NAD(P)-dependent oxidoreductase n=1 Tax=Arthrobacter echini TaxID=1529066 RepID=A0A4S5E5V0_9MICC|nr:SDR family NAD(P)-dependent oxidoreductase [Arthrobacter echini]
MADYLGLRGKNGLVTAAGDGIGRASALAFAEAGACVLISDISAEGLEETARLITEVGGEYELLVADSSLESTAQDAVTEWRSGGGRWISHTTMPGSGPPALRSPNRISPRGSGSSTSTSSAR